MWLKSWAFATSPHGLGLPEKRSWELTPREIDALAEVFKQKLWRWALERADYRNAHLGRDQVPYQPDDFLGGSNREQRQIDDAMSQMRVVQANAELAKIKRGAPPTEDVPSWAYVMPHEKMNA